jgi:Zn-dependent protease
MDQSAILYLIISIPVFVAALTVHEFAHAWAADRLGDGTPRGLGRLTLDPIKHLDPFGSLMFLISSLFGLGFGWAKPVPFNPRNLDNPRRDAMLIALAGPISNLLQVPIWMGLLYIYRMALQGSDPTISYQIISGLGRDYSMSSPLSIIGTMLALGIVLNLLLAVFNMIPLPPLDGHYVLEFLGPPAITDLFNAIRPYSFLILFVLIQLPGNPIAQIISPAVEFGYSLIGRALGLGRALG